MNAPTARTEHSWWLELRHGGILISRPVLQETFHAGALDSPWYAYQRLRDRFLSFQAWRAGHPDAEGEATPLHAWLDAVLEDFLGHPAARWQKGPHVAGKWAADLSLIGPTKPNRVLFLDDARERAALVVVVDRSARVGMGRGREAYSRLAQMLRAPGFPKLGLLTNGQQFRIVYAGLDHDAWAEFEGADWFEEGTGREQLDGFFTLLGAREGAGLHAAPPAAEAARVTYPLLQAVEASRSKQGDLASVLGEQVREAVEKLLDPVDRTLRKHPDFLDPLRKAPDGSELPQREVLAALYQAASRVVMRMVVAFFAEARGLLPRSLEGYNASYGLEGLFEQLQHARNAEGFLALDEPMRTSAWPRVLALFRLIHDGSPFADAPVRPYGGMLFRPGDPTSPDPVLRALALFESDRMEVTDARVLEVLGRLKIGQVKIKRGRQSAWVAAPVDFADLRTEYIGIIYEGLLDYELKMSAEVQVFLNLGQQPVLPLSILENMPPKNLKDLLDKLGKGEKPAAAEGDSAGDEADDVADDSTEETADAAPAEPTVPSEVEETLSSAADQFRQRAYAWAEKAVEIAGIVKKPTGKKASQYEYDKERKVAAQRLVFRVLDQGELYLVRWGGTRKGSGTFYTKPQLAVPTVHRTLEPLCYEGVGAWGLGAGKQHAEVGAKGLGIGDQHGNQELPRPGSVATGDEAGAGCVRTNEEAAKRGNLRTEQSDAASGGVNSQQHRGGAGQTEDRRVSQQPVSGQGVVNGASDTDRAFGTTDVHRRDTGKSTAGAVSNSGPTVARSDTSAGSAARPPNPQAPIPNPLKRPRPPDQILALQVCDPACGSGSFLVGALHYLTRALWESLHVHGRLHQQGKETLITLPLGEAAAGKVEEDVLPVPPSDERFEPMLKARLMRYVVERCLYGVDLNPLAVELCKLSLWVETLDPDLPMTFLDHKIRCGNALVGCWFDRFEDYPALAWEREGGDKQHSNGVRFAKGQLTAAIQKVKDERVRGELAELIAQRAGTWLFADANQDARQIHDKAREKLEELHALGVLETDERERRYRKLRAHPAFAALKEAFDAWCAVWFWPPTAVAEDNGLTPARWHDLVSHNAPKEHRERVQKDRDTVARLAREHRFLHWELEFPDVFTAERQGFDAVVGNPPWEILKPNSKEFFSNFDPVYRTYGKQEALTHQTDLFGSDPEVERIWVEYNAQFKALGAFASHAARPFGDPQDDGVAFPLAEGKSGRARSLELHTRWREQRAGRSGYADGEHPFRHQGSADVNTYKTFLELARTLLRDDGRLGIIVPSGLYTDKGTQNLRKLFLERCRWEWLFGFENKNGIFAIHRSFKFCPVVIQKGGKTEAIQTAFMRHDMADWEHAADFGLPYVPDRVKTYSPSFGAILEVRGRFEAEILDRMYANGVLIGNQGEDSWKIRYAREFDMTNDSKLFPPRVKWEEKGYRPDQYGRWIAANGDVAVPLYEGRMVGQFDYAMNEWSGEDWTKAAESPRAIRPKHLISYIDAFADGRTFAGLKTVFRDVCRTTDQRTAIATGLTGTPCGNTAAALLPKHHEHANAIIATINSFVFDLAARIKQGGFHLNYYVCCELPLLSDIVRSVQHLTLPCSSLSFFHVRFAPQWLRHAIPQRRWKQLWAITAQERLRLRCILDAIVAELYGLSFDDFAWILRQDRSDPKGFWRVDQDKPLELRHTTLALAAFRDLKEMGLDAFCAMNGGEGWMIPSEVADPAQWSLGDQGIIQLPKKLTQPKSADPSAQTPATERLGPRFLPWQLEGTPEDSWKECELHARNILGDEAFARLMAGEDPYAPPKPKKDNAAPAADGTDFQLTPATATKSAPRGKKRKDARGQRHMF